MTLGFKQLFYTHATKGVYHQQKGWQIVWASDKDYFRLWDHRLKTCLTIPEAENLPKGFLLFSLQTIGDLPALIRIRDAGKSADNRPGNIFAHVLIVDEQDKDKFYQYDALSIFSKWSGWRDGWDGESVDTLKDPIPVERLIDSNTLEQAANYVATGTGANDKLLSHLVFAGEKALDDKTAQYLVIHPKPPEDEATSDENGIHLFRVIWSWISDAQRKKVQFWTGRTLPRMPGFNWLILRHSLRAPITQNMLGHSAFGFDFSADAYTDFGPLPTRYGSKSDLPLTMEKIKRRNDNVTILGSFFGYHGRAKTDQLLQAYRTHVRQGQRPNPHQTPQFYSVSFLQEVTRILGTTAQNAPFDEPLRVMQSLFHLTQMRAQYSHKIDKKFIETAFRQTLGPAILTKAGPPILDALAELLAQSSTWKVEQDEIRDFYKLVFDGFASFVDNHSNKISRCEPVLLWGKIINKAEQDSEYWSLLKGLLLWDVGGKKEIARCVLNSLKLKQQIAWMTSKEPVAGDPERQWYQRFIRMLSEPGSKTLQGDELIAEILVLYDAIPEANTKSCVSTLLAFIGTCSLSPSDKIACTIRIYEQTHEQEQAKILDDSYFPLIARLPQLGSELDLPKSLLETFIEQEDKPRIKEELTQRLNTEIIKAMSDSAGVRVHNQTDKSRLSEYFTAVFICADKKAEGFEKSLAAIFNRVLRSHPGFVMEEFVYAFCIYLDEKKLQLHLQPLAEEFQYYEFCFMDSSRVNEVISRTDILNVRKRLLDKIVGFLIEDKELLPPGSLSLIKHLQLAELLKECSDDLRGKVQKEEPEKDVIDGLCQAFLPDNKRKQYKDFLQDTLEIFINHETYPALLFHFWHLSSKPMYQDAETFLFEFTVRFRFDKNTKSESKIEAATSQLFHWLKEGETSIYHDCMSNVIKNLKSDTQNSNNNDFVFLQNTLLEHLRELLEKDGFKIEKGGVWVSIAKQLFSLNSIANGNSGSPNPREKALHKGILDLASRACAYDKQNQIAKIFWLFYQSHLSIKTYDHGWRYAQQIEKYQCDALEYLCEYHRHEHYKQKDAYWRLTRFVKIFDVSGFVKGQKSQAKKLIAKPRQLDLKILSGLFCGDEKKNPYDIATATLKKLQYSYSSISNWKKDKVKFVPRKNLQWFKMLDLIFEKHPDFHKERVKPLDPKNDKLLEFMIKGGDSQYCEHLADCMLQKSKPNANTELPKPGVEIDYKTPSETDYVKRAADLCFYIHFSNHSTGIKKFLNRVCENIERHANAGVQSLLDSGDQVYLNFKAISEALDEFYEKKLTQMNHKDFQKIQESLDKFIIIDLGFGRSDLFKTCTRNDPERRQRISQLLSGKAPVNTLASRAQSFLKTEEKSEKSKE